MCMLVVNSKYWRYCLPVFFLSSHFWNYRQIGFETLFYELLIFDYHRFDTYHYNIIVRANTNDGCDGRH